jgi:hypothetical protein
MRGYPAWFYPMLMVTVMVLVLSGILLTPTLLDLRLEWQVPWRLEGNQQIAVAALHALFSFWMLALLGSLWNIHMRAGWRHRKHWKSGLSLALLMLFLMISAIGIYYLGDEQAATISAVAHLAAGAMVFLLFVYHAVIGYRRAVHRHPHPHSHP